MLFWLLAVIVLPSMRSRMHARTSRDAYSRGLEATEMRVAGCKISRSLSRCLEQLTFEHFLSYMVRQSEPRDMNDDCVQLRILVFLVASLHRKSPMAFWS
jgi:hypothetical protein